MSELTPHNFGGSQFFSTAIHVRKEIFENSLAEIEPMSPSSTLYSHISVKISLSYLIHLFLWALFSVLSRLNLFTNFLLFSIIVYLYDYSLFLLMFKATLLFLFAEDK